VKIALIGSTRFMDQYLAVNRQLSIGGHVVYSVATRSSSAEYKGDAPPQQLTDEEKETLDLVHLLKIQNSDLVVLTTDRDGYIGASTKREIKWSLMLGKQVILPEHVKDFREIEVGWRNWLKEALIKESPIDLTTRVKL
jgi:hypothetical protein